MKWEELTQKNAKELFEEYSADRNVNCQEEYAELREDLLSAFERVENQYENETDGKDKKKRAYYIDLHFGMHLYVLLTQKYGMSIREASNAGIWRFLSNCVVPDLVEKRYGVDHPDRFWKKPKRLWLRVIWWYVYLSWQGTAEDTIATLRNNSTDHILQLVDRCGNGGYRVEFCRDLMKKYAEYSEKNGRCSGEVDPAFRTDMMFFRKIMVLNTARVQVIEPELFKGGLRGYINSLYQYFDDREGNI